MADSYVFTREDKETTRSRQSNPLEQVPEFSLSDITPDVFDSLDTRDAYDLCFGDTWVDGLTPEQTLIVLRRFRSMYMRQINDLQKQIDRISLLEMDTNDPRGNVPWPRRYELRAQPERKPTPKPPVKKFEGWMLH